MKVEPIRTEADYEAALKEIERLFDAKAGTAEADRLEVLVTLVEVYEEKHYPIPLLSDALDHHGFSPLHDK